MIDTQSDLAHARRMIEMFGRVWAGMPKRVINTHEDADHVWGNALDSQSAADGAATSRSRPPGTNSSRRRPKGGRLARRRHPEVVVVSHVADGVRAVAFFSVYRAGSKSSIGFPSGSSTCTCRPPGPASI